MGTITSEKPGIFLLGLCMLLLGAPTASARSMATDLLGEWEACSGNKLHLVKSGEFRYEFRREKCSLGGRISIRDGWIRFDIQANTCGDKVPNWIVKPNRILLGTDAVVFTTGAMGSQGRHFTRARIRRETWRMTDDERFEGEVLLCFFEDGSFMDGHYRSVRGDCNFMGTCSGKIDDVQVKKGSTEIWMRCWGACPCNGIMVSTNTGVKRGGATKVMGHYRSTNCQTTFERTFTGQVTDQWPPVREKSR